MTLLFEDYSFSRINEDEFTDIFLENRKSVFENNVDFQVHQMLTELEKNKLKDLRNNDDFRLYLKITKSQQTIGWFFGRQSDDESFTMMNTGVFKGYRNKGIYSELLKHILEILEKEGFQKVESQHHASNNQVIIPKLKAGFIITGLQIEDKVGMMVRLTYYLNEKRRKVIDFRIGNKRLNKDFESYLNLWE